MTYTKSKKADKKVEADLKIIKEIILKEINLKAIILFGGFGHGNGSFKEEDNKITPLNDYDIYLITKNKLKGDFLEKLGKKCSLAIGRGGLEFVEDFKKEYDEIKFFHVDFHNIQLKNLKRLYPTQRTFDLKTSQVIYGNPLILNEIPSLKISKSDAIRLLFNKLDHFLISEGNSKKIKSIYAIKGFVDLCSALLIFEEKYVSDSEKRNKIFQKLKVPTELKRMVTKATNAKLYNGYSIPNVDNFFSQSKKWVEWTLKKILKKHLNLKIDNWKEIVKITYKKLPYFYFDDYLGNSFYFPAQYYLNIRFFLEGLRKKEFLIKSLIRWKDSGIIIALSLILYSFGEKEESLIYLKKLTGRLMPLKERILKLYSIYYLQKLI